MNKKVVKVKPFKMNIDKQLFDTIQTRILSLLQRKEGEWVGTMTELNRAITSGLRRAQTQNWPSTPSVLRRAINTVVPSLRRNGITVEFYRTSDSSRTRFVSFYQN